MEPQIRYVTSADGTRLAVYTLGRGRPLVIPGTNWLATAEMYLREPQSRANLERLAASRTVTLCDNRGYGLSERDVTDFSFEARASDLAAVIDSLDSPDIDLVGQAYSGSVAMNYAANNPGRVRRLCLLYAVARGRNILISAKQRILRQLIEVDWDLYVQTQVMVTVGWNDAGRFVYENVVDALAAEVFIATQRSARRDDVTSLLSRVICPTLVVHSRHPDHFISMDTSRQLAAALPNARLAVIDERPALSTANDHVMRLMEDFLEEGAEGSTASQSGGMTAILFVDIADSTPLTERLGDKAFREKARDLDAALRKIVRDASGTCIDAKTLGDGILATFTSAAQAIEAALACGKAGGNAGLPLHLGLHAGDVIREENNVFGGAVNIAARISGLSAPGELLVSDTVRSLARTSAGVTFEDRGEQSLKGVGEAVRVFAVRQA